jgi:hypothetical protein
MVYALNSDKEVDFKLAALEAPFASPMQLRDQLDLPVCSRTVTRTLTQFEIHQQIARQVDLLSA